MTAVQIPDDRLETASAEEVLTWAFEHFGDRVAIASSFGLEDVALIDMAASIRPDVRVFTLDTGRLNQETYDVMDRIRNRYDLALEVMFPDAGEVEAMVREHGINLFYDSVQNRKACCHVRKVAPLRRALSTVDAWITGMRRDQNVTRTAIAKVEVDEGNGGILKLNPLADWSTDQVESYVSEARVPRNALHAAGYPSIGCEPCTRAIQPGEDPRAGRWWWENPETKECGLHLKV